MIERVFGKVVSARDAVHECGKPSKLSVAPRSVARVIDQLRTRQGQGQAHGLG
jgi:hypothetical protein